MNCNNKSRGQFIGGLKVRKKWENYIIHYKLKELKKIKLFNQLCTALNTSYCKKNHKHTCSSSFKFSSNCTLII